MPIYLFNTLTRRKEELKPINAGTVGIYTCGPTVYDHAHIGNLRTYIFEDLLVRVLRYNGLEVRRVMNITDVGHLTGDGDMGEDKLLKGARREGKTAWEVAEFYAAEFKRDMERLNLLMPDIWCKATDHIGEQIELVKTLEAKGFTYRTSDGIYFDTAKFPAYNKLSHLDLDTLKEGARVEKNEEKRSPTDFALWKFSYVGGRSFDAAQDGGAPRRQMEWDSPWGKGFPGWHLECSAMSAKYLKGKMDIHCGGADHVNVHHTNEIAQSEAATGEKFFNIWMHGAFLNIAGGKKMAKSEGNFLTLDNAFVKKGIDPLVYRYAALGTHYRKPMEYGDGVMDNAAVAFRHLLNQVREVRSDDRRQTTDDRKERVDAINDGFKNKFLVAVNDDLNMPQAMAVLQEVLKSDIPNNEKLGTVLDFDRVLGLGLGRFGTEEDLPGEVAELARQRDRARADKDFALSDKLRKRIEDAGFVVEDGKEGMRVFRK